VALVRIEPNDRVFIAGKTGSGKTVLAKELLTPYPYVVVLDNKGRFNWPGAGLVTKLDLLPKAAQKYNHIVFRPNPLLEADAAAFKEEMDAFFWWVYYRQNCILYIDEASQPGVIDSFHIPAGLNVIYKRGRELNIGCWASSQEPVNVHNTLMSQADHFFAFITQMQSHRDKMAGYMGDPVKYTIPRNYKFFYFHPATMDEAEMMEPLQI